ncbi:hypothetical protein B0H14DRAFT_2642857 [Mycena olivaceomarginata]|nr:hypothetical protein B0H14DRAFT_2642857 [Mycena olivaceomarginata]
MYAIHVQSGVEGVEVDAEVMGGDRAWRSCEEVERGRGPQQVGTVDMRGGYARWMCAVDGRSGCAWRLCAEVVCGDRARRLSVEVGCRGWVRRRTTSGSGRTSSSSLMGGSSTNRWCTGLGYE